MVAERQVPNALLVAFGSISVAGLVAWAASVSGARLGGMPVVVGCAVLAFAAQWIAFVPAFVAGTERYYDLVGSLTYLGVTAFAILASDAASPRAILLGVLVAIWALRLGTFLFQRIRADGSDPRFDHIKRNASRFFIAWTLQGLWVFLTLCAALAAITAVEPTPLRLSDLVGLALWTLGFSLETIADHQKRRFREAHPGRYVDEGLWAWSRHPNYLGEIVLWIGVAVIASSTLRGWQWVTLISPVFVTVLLTRISGIPLLEKRADARWGDDEGYRAYKARTPVLIPRPRS